MGTSFTSATFDALYEGVLGVDVFLWLLGTLVQIVRNRKDPPQDNARHRRRPRRTGALDHRGRRRARCAEADSAELTSDAPIAVKGCVLGAG